VRGYLWLSGGVGEIDGRATVEFYLDEAGYQRNAKGMLDAWRKLDPGFVGLHGGLAYALSQRHALTLELRFVQMLAATAQGVP